MRIIRYISSIMLFLIISTNAFGQLDSVWHQGPAVGSVASGVQVMLTATLDKIELGDPIIRGDRNVVDPFPEPMIIEYDESILPEYKYVKDLNATENPNVGGGQTVLLQKFPAIGQTNSIPPDPHLAVGPNHVIACVNSRFSVWDKEGNLIASRDADNWISPVIGNGAFDPQIMYDHYEGRWFMLWDWQNDGTQQAYFVISYTDDDDPLGTWYMYLMDAKLNGTQNSNTWGDYPQVGYDEEAIFINSRSFAFGGSYFYNRIRIVSKSELYASNGGMLTWKDIWNIRTPGQGAGGQPLDVIHPVYSYTPGSGSWFFWANRTGANFYCAYTILNPLSSSPRIRGKVIPVTFYAGAPNASQLGGGTPLIEANGSHVKTQPVLRDGKIYVSHSIRNTQGVLYASAKYAVYDIGSETVTEEAELGAIGYWYIYPTITVDKDHNIAVTFSRSAETEYIGAYYSTKQSTSPPGLSPSLPIQEGLGNYIVTFGGTRNRWGDYLGICIDPTTEYNVWMLSEYAAGTNQWGTYIAEIRMAPYSGVHAFTSTTTVDLGNVQVGTASDIGSAIVSNYGDTNLEIQNMPLSMGEVSLVNGAIFPVTLSSYDSLDLQFLFSPTTAGAISEDFAITSNDPNLTNITVIANGYNMYPALDKTFYASSGSQNNGETLTIDKLTGAGTNIGASNFTDIKDVAINETSGIMYAVRSSSLTSEILRVNAGQGDAYLLYELDLPEMESIAFDTNGDLYGALKNGEIYSIDISNGSYSLVTTAPIELLAIAFNTLDNSLWATVRNIVGTQKDRIYTIDKTTGDTTRVGRTGYNITTNSIAFDETGVLYGISGSASQDADFFTINTSNGTGTLIGSVALKGLTGIAYAETGVTSVNDDENQSTIPSEFSLSQNYPNPFNPTTTITFTLPQNADVTLNIYNVLGQQISTLINEERSAGTHTASWNAVDSRGVKLSSGIYFYELKANSSSGEFQQIRKMVLMK